MAKRKDLSEVMKQSAAPQQALQSEVSVATDQLVIGAIELQESRAPQPLPPSRQGKKTIAGHFDPAVSRQLRTIALEEDSSVQALLQEALNDLFTKRGNPPIAS